jgi:hypothetical protein
MTVGEELLLPCILIKEKLQSYVHQRYIHLNIEHPLKRGDGVRRGNYKLATMSLISACKEALVLCISSERSALSLTFQEAIVGTTPWK